MYLLKDEPATRNRERVEQRKYEAIDAHFLKGIKHFPGMKSFIKVTSQRTTKSSSTIEYRYYISSLDPTDKRIPDVIRSHWGIENTLHYVLDVVWRQDYSRIRTKNAPENINKINHFVLNLINVARDEFKESISAIRKICCLHDNTFNKLIDVLRF